MTYPGSFDVLAAGEARFDPVLHQGIRPVWSLSWPGITAKTRFIIEALDAGCPFAGGNIAATHANAAPKMDFLATFDAGADWQPFT